MKACETSYRRISDYLLKSYPFNIIWFFSNKIIRVALLFESIVFSLVYDKLTVAWCCIAYSFIPVIDEVHQWSQTTLYFSYELNAIIGSEPELSSWSQIPGCPRDNQTPVSPFYSQTLTSPIDSQMLLCSYVKPQSLITNCSVSLLQSNLRVCFLQSNISVCLTMKTPVCPYQSHTSLCPYYKLQSSVKL